MALRKAPKADLRRQYKKVFEISLIISLVVLIVAFKFFPDIEPTKAIAQGPQELINLEDVQQTRQQKRPPPPPKPPIPIEAPSEDVLEDIEIQSTELDLTEEVKPPPKEVKTDEEPTYFVAVEEMPRPIGGIAAIQEKIIYPEIAKRAGIEGRVYVKAYVDEKGNVTKVEVIKGLGAGLDEAALKAVKATKFYPGKQRGKAVKVQVSIPIVFRLN